MHSKWTLRQKHVLCRRVVNVYFCSWNMPWLSLRLLLRDCFQWGPPGDWSCRIARSRTKEVKKSCSTMCSDVMLSKPFSSTRQRRCPASQFRAQNLISSISLRFYLVVCSLEPIRRPLFQKLVGSKLYRCIRRHAHHVECHAIIKPSNTVFTVNLKDTVPITFEFMCRSSRTLQLKKATLKMGIHHQRVRIWQRPYPSTPRALNSKRVRAWRYINKWHKTKRTTVSLG